MKVSCQHDLGLMEVTQKRWKVTSGFQMGVQQGSRMADELNIDIPAII